MARPRKYASDAERQRAYRNRRGLVVEGFAQPREQPVSKKLGGSVASSSFERGGLPTEQGFVTLDEGKRYGPFAREPRFDPFHLPPRRAVLTYEGKWLWVPDFIRDVERFERDRRLWRLSRGLTVDGLPDPRDFQ